MENVQIKDKVTLRYLIVRMIGGWCCVSKTIEETLESAKKIEEYIEGDADLPDVSDSEEKIIRALKENFPRPESNIMGITGRKENDVK